MRSRSLLFGFTVLIQLYRVTVEPVFVSARVCSKASCKVCKQTVFLLCALSSRCYTFQPESLPNCVIDHSVTPFTFENSFEIVPQQVVHPRARQRVTGNNVLMWRTGFQSSWKRLESFAESAFLFGEFGDSVLEQI